MSYLVNSAAAMATRARRIRSLMMQWVSVERLWIVQEAEGSGCAAAAGHVTASGPLPHDSFLFSYDNEH